MSAPGRPKRELLRPPHGRGGTMRLEVGRHPRSQTRPSGLGFALLARASLGGTARSAKGALMSAPGRPKREWLPLGGKARSAKGAHR